MLPHIYGLPNDMDKILKIVKKFIENNFSVKYKPHPQDKDNASYSKTFFGDDIATDLYQEIKN